MLNSGIFPEIESWFKRKTGQDAVLLGVILLFFFALLPLAASFLIYYPTERHYTDAALSMLQSGDYFTPREADGSFRFLKPPMTYWILVGSYKLFGVNAFSSRLVFLLAGCGVIAATYALTLRLTNAKRYARLAALVMLAQPVLILISIRSMPDVLLTLCLLLSAYGFLRLICLADTATSAYWCAYVGAALGIATKGLLGVVFVIYAVSFAYFTRQDRQSLRRLFDLKALIGALLVSCFWFLLMSWKHGGLFLHGFWSDQVGQKVDVKGSALVRVATYYSLYLLNFLPWLLALVYCFSKRRTGLALEPAQRRACLFIGVWALLLPLIFGFGNNLSARYLLPAFPLVATGLVLLLSRFPEEDLEVAGNRLFRVVVAIFFAMALFALVVLWQTQHLLTYLAGPIVVVLSILLFFLRRWRKAIGALEVFALSFFLLFPLVIAMASPFTLPDQSDQIAHGLQKWNPAGNPIVLVGPAGLASRVRITTQNRFPVYQIERMEGLKDSSAVDPAPTVSILRQPGLQRMRGPHRFHEVASGYDNVSIPKLAEAIVQGNAKRYLDGQREFYYVAIPEEIRSGADRSD